MGVARDSLAPNGVDERMPIGELPPAGEGENGILGGEGLALGLGQKQSPAEWFCSVRLSASYVCPHAVSVRYP